MIYPSFGQSLVILVKLHKHQRILPSRSCQIRGSRRFRAANDAREARELAQEMGDVVSGPHFDSNCITPGKTRPEISKFDMFPSVHTMCCYKMLSNCI